MKVLSGEETSPEEWQQHLREVHRRLPGVTSAVFARHGTLDGKTSYELLAESAVVGARGLDRAVDVLDLACGDGYLIEVCLRELAGSIGTVIGVDFSEGELDLARRRLAGQSMRLQVGFAQALPLTAESVDVVLCHAAFMLMVPVEPVEPVEPVVAGLARVLRSGGSFNAVVGSTSHRLLARIRVHNSRGASSSGAADRRWRRGCNRSQRGVQIARYRSRRWPGGLCRAVDMCPSTAALSQVSARGGR